MPNLFLPPHILRMASTLCSQCVKQALAKNDIPQCMFISRQQGCRFGDNCVNRHQRVCKDIGHCKAHDKGECDLSHTLPPCTHSDAPAARASARAPPAPVLIKAPRAQAAAPAPPTDNIQDMRLDIALLNEEISEQQNIIETLDNDKTELTYEAAGLREEKAELSADNAKLFYENQFLMHRLNIMMRHITTLDQSMSASDLDALFLNIQKQECNDAFSTASKKPEEDS